MENRIKLDELIRDEILLEYEKIKETTKKDDFNFVRANYALRKGLTIKELSKSTQHEELKKEMHEKFNNKYNIELNKEAFSC